MKTMLVSEAKPILGELVREAAMGQEIRISTRGFVARLVAGAETRSTGKEMVAHMTGRRQGQFSTDEMMKAVRG
ncbi:MAG: type II toxin-antitoxin system prevent-host-death family antitoxin [Verrucomicrobia bacterium]|nr:type II toxin-antitoxin system prevent-host-death family antitoxin [Verrucomicrobiota bacterium]